MPIVRLKDAKRRRRRMAYINGSKPFHYYNEWDAKTAAWLRELIRRGHLPDGIVDERSITEVAPEDLRGFRQWHFFAGIGGWPLALKLAGWPAYAPVCTGSPPCQPFSVAGKRGGRDDSRHLAPAFLDLIAELRPPAVFGEQVSAAIKELWLDALFVELEDEGYTCASAVLPACSVGAPHKRDRLFFGAIDLADTNRQRWERERGNGNTQGRKGPNFRQAGLLDGAGTENSTGNPHHGFWSDADWIGCRDGKFRPVESGTQPLVNGVPARVVRLRGYGNAIVPQVAAQFIRNFMVGTVDFLENV